MSDLNPAKIQEFFEATAKANAEAWSTQAKFHEENLKSSVDCFTDLSKARTESLQEMAEAQTLTQAFEANLAFEERVREDLEELQEKSVKAWENLVENLQSIYAITFEGEAKPASKAKKQRKSSSTTSSAA